MSGKLEEIIEYNNAALMVTPKSLNNCLDFMAKEVIKSMEQRRIFDHVETDLALRGNLGFFLETKYINKEHKITIGNFIPSTVSLEEYVKNLKKAFEEADKTHKLVVAQVYNYGKFVNAVKFDLKYEKRELENQIWANPLRMGKETMNFIFRKVMNLVYSAEQAYESCKRVITSSQTYLLPSAQPANK